MASVRKRTWKSGGETKTAWIADYFDGAGIRRLKTFPTKKVADAWLVVAQGEVARGVHSPDSASITVAEAAELWIRRGEVEKLERSSLSKYRNHVELHINPRLGAVKLARLTAPTVEKFRDDLLGTLSWAMARKCLASLKMLINEAQRRGLVAQNAAATVKIRPRPREEGQVEIPSKGEVTAILAAAPARWRPLLVTAVYTGMRASELRGLTWDNVDFEQRVIHVRQRADQWGVIGKPKSRAGFRNIPMSPSVFYTLREWRLACPRVKEGADDPGRLWLVFPTRTGKVDDHGNIINRGFNPTLVKAGVGHYGFHALRHFFASWAIEQGLSPKKLQTLLGHSTITMTFDRYGHVFKDLDDDHAKFAAGELAMAR
jgi:integrase